MLTKSGVNLRARYLASIPLTAEFRETPFQKLQRNLKTPTWLRGVRRSKHDRKSASPFWKEGYAGLNGTKTLIGIAVVDG